VSSQQAVDDADLVNENQAKAEARESDSEVPLVLTAMA